ncbi:MAG: PKD domain-containing protein [Candidatus Bipolaricaulia bacterium]
MKRRSPGFVTLTLLFLLLTGSLGAVAADVPVVLQLSDPAFSASERSEILAGAEAVKRILSEGHPVSSSRLVAQGWIDRDFVLFAAGSLQSLGYETVIVEGVGESGVNQLWILVGIALSDRTAWVPVEAVPSNVGSRRLGRIPWTGASGTPFTPMYLAFDRVIELAPNAAPTASFIATGNIVVDERTSLHSHANDPDGKIIAYVWSIDGEEAAVKTTAIYNHVFIGLGDRDVTLVVIDNRGARGTFTKTLEVLTEEEASCGCH